MLVNQPTITETKAITAHSCDNATHAINHQCTLIYWYIGKRISEAEQQGKDRADYGTWKIR